MAPAKQKGFTLVELMVSIAIFTVITTVAVFNNAQFNGSVILTNLAYEVALSIRQAQYYGISVRQDLAQDFNSGYGVDFNTATPYSYILFEDKTGGSSHVYDVNDPLVQTFNITKGNKVFRLCVDSDCTKSVVDVSFIRPNPDAYITANGALGVYYGKLELCLSSPRGDKRKVTIASTGQISAGNDASGICN